MFYKPAFNWMILGFGVRITIGMVIHIYSLEVGFEGFVPLSNFGDDIVYWLNTDQIMSGNASDDLPNFYPFFLSAVFTIVGRELLIGKLINLIASSLTIYFSILIARELSIKIKLNANEQRYASNLTGLFLTFYPSTIFFSTQLIKDPLTVFCGILNLYLIILILIKQKYNLFIWWALTLVFTFALRPYAAVALIITSILYLALIWKARFKTKLIALIILLPPIALIPYLLGKGLFAIEYVQQWTDLEKVSQFREVGYSTGGSAADISLDYSNPVSFIFTYGLSIMTAMFGPFPWQLRAANHFIALPETLCIWCLVLNQRKVIFNNSPVQNNGHEERILLLFTILLIAFIALFSDNIGANIRIRQLAWNSFFIYWSIRLAIKRHKKVLSKT